jgi:two-component system chemotaxis sensor kinase CheA
MNMMNTMEHLAEKALHLRPGDMRTCGEMLSLLDSVSHPELTAEIALLKGYLEEMILSEFDGKCPDPEKIRDAVEAMRKRAETLSDGVSPVPHPSDILSEIPDEIPYPAAGPVTAEMSGEDAEVMKDFIAEAYEHLQSIELRMVDWEKSPADREIINSIFRPFHTIKGVSGFLNLTEINRISHLFESVLDEARNGAFLLDHTLSDLIFEGIDAMRFMLSSLEKALKDRRPVAWEGKSELLCRRLETFLNTAVRAHQAEPDDRKSRISEIKFREDALNAILKEREAVSSSKPPEKGAAPRPDVRESIPKHDNADSAPEEKFIKVSTGKMDQLVDMMGELVITQSMVVQNPEVVKITDPRFIRDIAQLQRVTAALQNISMSMRLVAFGATFRKMNRIVRDLARKTGKNIALSIQGHSAEIDRNMVEELHDPLVHMIRNACDHGIGTPEERKACGKPEEGTIFLKAEHAGGRVVITISDDGNGLDREAILAKAIERGLIDADSRPDERTIDSMIFTPGFSTTEKITEISGRGVGMDVVKKTLEKLHGTIDIFSEKGAGTTFVIKLPLTTAIINGLLVQVGSERYIIPMYSVRRIIRPGGEDLSTLAGKGEMVRISEKLIPIVRLDRVLHVEGACPDPCRGVLIVVDDGGGEAALLVDTLLGKQEVVIKNLGKRFEDLEGVSGGVILADGRIGLILDIGAVLHGTEMRS